MIHLELTAEEQAILVDLLQSAIADLRTEIRDTDNQAYKDMLKQRRQILSRLVETIQNARAAAPVD